MPEKYELGEGIVGVELVEFHDDFHEVEVGEHSLEGDATGFTGKAVNGGVNDEQGGRHGGSWRFEWVKRMEGTRLGFDLYISGGWLVRERDCFLVPKCFRPKRTLPRIPGTDDVGWSHGGLESPRFRTLLLFLLDPEAVQ